MNHKHLFFLAIAGLIVGYAGHDTLVAYQPFTWADGIGTSL